MRRNNRKLYESIMKDVAKAVKRHLNEVSVDVAQSAADKVTEEIKELVQQFTDSKFQDMTILAKLQRRARQIDVFNNYVDNVNNETIDVTVKALKAVLNKWKDGRELSNGTVFKPLFVLATNTEATSEDFVPNWGNGLETTWKNENPNYEFNKLTVIGLNSDYEKEIKSLKKLGMDITELENRVQEYKDINQELKDDLESVNGIKFSYSNAERKNSRNPYNTIIMLFDVDTNLNLIDPDKLAQKFGSYAFNRSDFYTRKGSHKGRQGSFRRWTSHKEIDLN